jgi:hypothetical protein
VRPRALRGVLFAAAASALWSGVAGAAQPASETFIGSVTASSGPVSVSVDDRWAALDGARAPSYTGVSATLYTDPMSGREFTFSSSVTHYGTDLVYGPAGLANDYSAEFEVDQPIGRLTVYALAGYQTFGAAPGFDSVAGSYATIGASYPVVGRLRIGASFDADESLSTLGPDRSVTLRFSGVTGEVWHLQSYLTRGLSAASDDWRVGISVSAPW